jgi:hypothetical protein
MSKKKLLLKSTNIVKRFEGSRKKRKRRRWSVIYIIYAVR